MKPTIDSWDPAQTLEFEVQLMQILDAAHVQLSAMKPSEWAEENRMMTSDVSPMPGMFRYYNSPYTKPIVDCLDPNHPARVIAIMKGAQIGFTTGVIENGIGWIVAQQPGNILYLVGHDTLVKPTAKKLDSMIDNSGIRHLIKSSSKRARKMATGDTDKMKEFPGGNLLLGPANHGMLRNISVQYGFIDDFEKMKSADKSSGSTAEMIEQRFAAYYKKMKLMYISTPEMKKTSNIEPEYLKGDQRKWHIPAPCCGEFIALEWRIESEIEPGEMAGITWETDSNGRVVDDSVGYVCQKCGGFFDDRNKMELIRAGEFRATAEPSEPGRVSFHISSLYGPTYMFDWAHYVRKYIEAFPEDGPVNEAKAKTFMNLVLGKTFEAETQKVSAGQLQKNVRQYSIGTLPEKLSIADGNGKIVMLTMACDLNGQDDSVRDHTRDDARLDWEIVAWSETGATYSIDHGSIGTFIPRDKHPEKREWWTYKHGANNSVWPVLQSIMERKFECDTNGRKMKIFISGIDAGFLPNYVYRFIDNCNGNAVALKGDDDADAESLLLGTKMNADMKTFRPARERANLYLVATNHTKDLLANHMVLKWDPEHHTMQPFGFMNFPIPSNGKYLFENYFSHFEAEHKVFDNRGKYRWLKRSQKHQNHLFDCRLYNMVVRDIFLDKLFKSYKIKNGTWADFVAALPK